jgi:hypothetical protein
MIPSREACLDRIGTCISDLDLHGIYLLKADERKRFQLVHEHLEYFQLMLGYDSAPAEVLQLLRDRSDRF